MDIAIHLARPLQKIPEADALGPEKLPEFEKSDLRHFDAGIGLDPPQMEGTAPRSEPVAASGVPEKTQHRAHWVQCTGPGDRGLVRSPVSGKSQARGTRCRS